MLRLTGSCASKSLQTSLSHFAQSLYLEMVLCSRSSELSRVYIGSVAAFSDVKVHKSVKSSLSSSYTPTYDEVRVPQ